MIEDFMYVLENYPNADLSSDKDRKLVAESLVNIMCEHHIVTYTNLDAAKNDPKMLNWIKQCKNRNEESTEDQIQQMELPLEKGL